MAYDNTEMPDGIAAVLLLGILMLMLFCLWVLKVLFVKIPKGIAAGFGKLTRAREAVPYERRFDDPC